LKTLIFLTGAFIIIIYIGIPIFAKTILFFSASPKNRQSYEISGSSFILPPTLETPPSATNSAKITLSGYTDKKTRIKIYVNETLDSEAVSDDKGKFEVKNISLSEGENIIYAISENNSEKSGSSNTVSVRFKKSAPKLEITSPEQEEKYVSDSNIYNIRGISETENSISINGRLAIIDQNGNFSISFTLNEGENKFEFSAVDPFGNQKKEERILHYSRD